MNILHGKLHTYFNISHLLSTVGILVLVYAQQVIVAVALIVIASFLRTAVPFQISKRNSHKFCYQVYQFSYIYLTIWFIQSTENKIVVEFADFIIENKYHPLLLFLLGAFIVSKYLVDRDTIQSLNTQNIIEYYEETTT